VTTTHQRTARHHATPGEPVKKHSSYDLLIKAALYVDSTGLDPLSVYVHGDRIRIQLHNMPLDRFTELAASLTSPRFAAHVTGDYVQVLLSGELDDVPVTVLVCLDRSPCVEVMPELTKSYVGASLTVTAEQVRAFAPASVPA
jgi:hypothetical protein